MKIAVLHRMVAVVAQLSAFVLTVGVTTSASAQTTPWIYTVAGNGGNGYAGDGGPATEAYLNGPRAVAVDSSGNVYFADLFSNVVRKVAAGSGVITTVAGTGIAGYSGDGGPATSAELFGPNGVALDGFGDLYISEFPNCVLRKVNLSNGLISTVAGNGTCAASAGDNGPAASAQLAFSNCVATDSLGNIYLCDNQRIREVNAATGIITTVAGNGGSGYSGDGGPAISASFRIPMAVAVDRFGNLFIADQENNVIRKVSASDGTIATVAGNGYGAPYYGGYSGDGGPATSAELYYPNGVAVDSAGNLYIAEYYNQVVRKVTASNGVISTFAGIHALSCAETDAAPATSGFLCGPEGLAVDTAGDLFIAELPGARVREVLAAAPPTTEAAAPTFSLSAGTYASPQTVTISDTTPGAAIYITINGSTPTTSSQGYRGAIHVTAASLSGAGGPWRPGYWRARGRARFYTPSHCY